MWKMIGAEAVETFLTKFRVGPYSSAPTELKTLWLWFMKDVCGKVSRPWVARVKLFKADENNDYLRTYLSMSDEVFAQLCVVLYHNEYTRRTEGDWKPKKGRKKGTDDLGSKMATKQYKTLFMRLKEIDDQKMGYDWDEAVMCDISVPDPVQNVVNDDDVSGLGAPSLLDSENSSNVCTDIIPL